MTLLDASAEMLAVAKEKLDYAIKDKRIDAVVKTTLPNLPFADRTFDAVMFNQVASIGNLRIKDFINNPAAFLRP